MKPKKWVLISLLIIMLLLIFNTLLMVWIDSYSIAHPKQDHYYCEPNRNFLKTEYIRSNPTLYDSFIFGSSKVGAINPYEIKEGHFYNMTYSAGIPHEHLINIKLFLRSGVKIKHLLIGFEEISYLEPFAKRQHQGITKAHPLATGNSWLSQYLYYFFRFPAKVDRTNLMTKLFHPDRTVTMDVFHQKSYYAQLTQQFQNRDINETEYVQQPKFSIPAGYHGDELKGTLNDIKEIIQVCRANHIDVKFFINPIHNVTYEATDKALLTKFKYSLAQLTDYYDFSGPNSITRNNLYWSDTTHYDIRVGEYILESLYHYGKPPKDFGIYVHKTAIE
jgi:hypothetical protein